MPTRSIYIRDKLDDKIKELAKKYDLPYSVILRRAIIQYLKSENMLGKPKTV